jgi:hypothetical protein
VVSLKHCFFVFFQWREGTHEVVEEETVVERETRIVECERLALVRGGGDDDLSDAHIFKLGTCPSPTCEFLRKRKGERKAARQASILAQQAHL